MGIGWMIFIYLMDMVWDMSSCYPLDGVNGRWILEMDNWTGFLGYLFHFKFFLIRIMNERCALCHVTPIFVWCLSSSEEKDISHATN